MAAFLNGFRDEMARQWPAPVVLRMEDIAPEFPAGVKFEEWLEQKYRNVQIDLVAAVEGPGTMLGVRFRDRLRPGLPVVVSGIGAERYREFAGHANLTGVTIDQDVRGMLAAARRLYPEGRHLCFFSGSVKLTPEARDLWQKEAEVFAAAEGMSYGDLTGLPYESLLERLRALPPNSMILRRNTIAGGLARPAGLARDMSQLSAAANGPLFTVADACVVDGSAGTGWVDYERLGMEMATQAAAVFKAGNAASVPAAKSAAFTLSYDWRQLQRWGLDEKRLPPGSDLRYRLPGLWEEHRKTMIGITAALAVQTGLIVALLLQRRWRKRAETALQQQREQLSHTLRLATMSQMASSLAHELNQPLTAIVNNAGTARRMIARGSGDAAQFGEILQDITDDGHRAGEVIRGIRSMVRPGESSLQSVSLAGLIAGARRMVEAEARVRGCTIIGEIAPDLPPLAVNAVQIQQVLLNLLMNAFEAMESTGAATRRVVIRAEAEGAAAICVSLRDFGPGLPPDGPERLFGPYFTTKPNGMGMGLVIVRNIIEAHGGSIGAANADGGGARFYFRLPAVKQVSA